VSWFEGGAGASADSRCQRESCRSLVCSAPTRLLAPGFDEKRWIRIDVPHVAMNGISAASQS
jgi:hypothetical protein